MIDLVEGQCMKKSLPSAQARGTSGCQAPGNTRLVWRKIWKREENEIQNIQKNLYQNSDLTSSHNFIFFCQSCSVISFEENLKKWREKIETHLLGEPRLSSIEPWKLKNWNRIYCPVFHGIAWYRCLFKILSNGVSTKKTGAWRCLNISLIKEHHRPMRLYLSLTISRLDGWRTFPHFWTTFSRTSTRWK